MGALNNQLLCLMLSMVLVLSGCASIIHGTSQELTVTSDPIGATVTVDGGATWTTPATIDLKRKRDHVLIVTLQGFQTEQVVIMHVVSGAVAGNILLGGLIGWGVDAATGAQYRLVPEQVHVQLKPLAEGEVATDSPLLQMTTEDKLVELQKLYEKKLITETEYQAMRKLLLNAVVVVPSEDEVTTEPAQ